jgi:hypothetical protein
MAARKRLGPTDSRSRRDGVLMLLAYDSEGYVVGTLDALVLVQDG